MIRFTRNRCRWMPIGMLAFGVVGCSPEAQRYKRFPDFANPGTAAAQRADAVYHDPFPLNDIGPEIVGGRPLGFQQPRTEVDRARTVPPQPVVIQSAPLPGTTVLAPPVISSPYAVAPAQPAVQFVPAPGAVTTASPITGPPIVTMPAPGTPAAGLPVVPAYPAPPAPVAMPTYPPVATPPTGPAPLQPRAPY